MFEVFLISEVSSGKIREVWSGLGAERSPGRPSGQGGPGWSQIVSGGSFCLSKMCHILLFNFFLYREKKWIHQFKEMATIRPYINREKSKVVYGPLSFDKIV